MAKKNANRAEAAPRRVIAAALSAVALLAALGAATYAWFTSNSKVNTNSVSVHSDESALVVELGDSGAGKWTSEGDAAFSTSSPDDLTLYPVSTFDLTGFAECAANASNGAATVFQQAADGQHYYHGWTDVRASVTGSGASKAAGKAALYLADTLAPADADPELLRAARVGIKISRGGEVVKTAIFELDSSAGTNRSDHPATSPSLAGYVDGMLLGWSDAGLTCGNDVTEDFSGYVMGTGEDAVRPQSALAQLELGQVYRMDVYYYIEGTDADSADYLYGDVGTLHLSLFAVLDGREG